MSEITKENQILHQKNQFILKHYEEIKSKLEDAIFKNTRLEKFEPSFLKLQEKLPNYSIEKLIDKFEYLEEINMNFIKKTAEFEDEKLKAEKSYKKDKEIYEGKLCDISKKNQENERFLHNLREQMHTQESELHTQDNYKTQYFELFSRILHIFNVYSEKIPLFFNQKDEKPPKSSIENPLEMLDFLEKLINIGDHEKLVGYLRKIMVNANVLLRRFIPEKVNERFNPERVYELIVGFIEQMKGEILKQKSEINNLRLALAKEKSKMSVKCEEKSKEKKRGKSAKIEEKKGEIQRRNAFF